VEHSGIARPLVPQIGYFKAQQVVEWRKDNHALILGDRSLARLVRWRDEGISYQPDGKGWK